MRFISKKFLNARMRNRDPTGQVFFPRAVSPQPDADLLKTFKTPCFDLIRGDSLTDTPSQFIDKKRNALDDIEIK